MENLDKIILIDKPKGITSFDVIRQLRKKIGVRKMGHAGTLDPLASGLMIIGIQEGTKLLNNFLKLPKTYEAHILLGKSTTTGDMEGEVVSSGDAGHIKKSEIEKVTKEMVGTHNIKVPIYSAIKQGGVPLYKKARAGHDVEAPVKEMTVTHAILEDLYEHDGYPIIKINFDVSSGTYIRSLAEEFGKKLNVPATLFDLRRLTIGDFSVEDAMDL